MEEKRFCKTCNKETWHKHKQQTLLGFGIKIEFWECVVCVEKARQWLYKLIGKKLSESV